MKALIAFFAVFLFTATLTQQSARAYQDSALIIRANYNHLTLVAGAPTFNPTAVQFGIGAIGSVKKIEVSGSVGGYIGKDTASTVWTLVAETQALPVNLYGKCEWFSAQELNKLYFDARAGLPVASGKRNRIELGATVRETYEHPLGFGAYADVRLNGRYDQTIFRFAQYWLADGNGSLFLFSLIFDLDLSRYRLFDIYVGLYGRRGYY